MTTEKATAAVVVRGVASSTRTAWSQNLVVELVTTTRQQQLHHLGGIGLLPPHVDGVWWAVVPSGVGGRAGKGSIKLSKEWAYRETLCIMVLLFTMLNITDRLHRNHASSHRYNDVRTSFIRSPRTMLSHSIEAEIAQAFVGTPVF